MTPKTQAVSYINTVRTIGEYIERRRAELGIKQHEIATAIGIKSADFIGLVEKGVRSLDLDRIPALAEILQANPVDLCHLALSEQLPVLAQTIFANPAVLRKDLDAKPSTIDDEVSFKLRALDKAVREPIIYMVRTLYDQQQLTRRSKKRMAG